MGGSKRIKKSKTIDERKHDLEEVATAIEQMFEASASRGEKEPDMDLIADILDEYFPGLTMEELANAGAIFRTRLTSRDSDRAGRTPANRRTTMSMIDATDDELAEAIKAASAAGDRRLADALFYVLVDRHPEWEDETGLPDPPPAT